ncbi:lysophospholipid acyltransferase family protein [Candidatus Sumerlaeota bacterium]|nr:lysophospholipid acyltransferase family protein [Candidatus Sumerlaeota bacterium]MBI3737220.1 lysophospholipid acyltransferase family protein [Candidatus Sumerlaeota bacterium]
MGKAPTTQLRLGERLAIGLGGRIIRGLLRIWLWSLKVELRGFENFEGALASGRPVLWAAWHGDILAAIFTKLGVCVPPLVTMISRSRDGEIVSRLVEPIGIVCVRASSSKGGARGILEMQSLLTSKSEDGAPRAGIHFLDGPRGPRHEAKPGIVLIARSTQALVVPVCFGISRRWVTRSWDRHRIPKPFSKVICVFGKPIAFAAESKDEEGAAAIESALQEMVRNEPLCAQDDAA